MTFSPANPATGQGTYGGTQYISSFNFGTSTTGVGGTYQITANCFLTLLYPDVDVRGNPRQDLFSGFVLGNGSFFQLISAFDPLVQMSLVGIQLQE